jgi:hypothetical protein
LIESYIQLLEKTQEKGFRRNILNLLANLAYAKPNKQGFIVKEIAIESVVNILGHFKTSYNEKALASQFFVNL